MPKRPPTSNNPFSQELPRILSQRGISLRALAADLGGIDHAYLSRMLRGERSVNLDHVRRISRYLGLPSDYFPEVREEVVVDAIRAKPALRDQIYNRLKRKL